jgi:hypothetical protein
MLRRQIKFIGVAAIKRIGACNSVNWDAEKFRIGQIVGQKGNVFLFGPAKNAAA